jgi:predicted metal-dependent hydrolase
MPAKVVELNGVGTVKLYKRSGTKGIRLTLGSDHTIRVTMPPWVPYQTALSFVQSKKDWISTNTKPKHVFQDKEPIGKSHRISFAPGKPGIRVANGQVRILFDPVKESSDLVQERALKGAYRALKKEAAALLPQRTKTLADKYGFSYQNLSVKQMRSRWGSCSQQKNLSLNIFLMQLPWRLIDYVIIHELVHTKVLNHGKDFWHEMQRCLPNVAQLRKEIRQHKPNF